MVVRSSDGQLRTRRIIRVCSSNRCLSLAEGREAGTMPKLEGQGGDPYHNHYHHPTLPPEIATDAAIYVAVIVVFYAAIIILLVGTNLHRLRRRGPSTKHQHRVHLDMQCKNQQQGKKERRKGQQEALQHGKQDQRDERQTHRGEQQDGQEENSLLLPEPRESNPELKKQKMTTSITTRGSSISLLCDVGTSLLLFPSSSSSSSTSTFPHSSAGGTNTYLLQGGEGEWRDEKGAVAV